MVQTRSGNVVIHMEASYGRAARSESSRKRRKRKAANDQNAANATTPRRRAPTRSQIQYDEALATPPGASARVGSTPLPNKTDRILRGTTRKPRCSDFGKTRHFAFHGQGLMFCNACDLWDALPPDATNKVSIDSLKFGCTANHTYFSHPTTLRKQDCYIRRKRKVVIPILNVQHRVVPNYGVAFNEESDSSFASSFDGDEVVVVDQGNSSSSAHHNNNNSRTTTTSSTGDPSDNDDNQPILGSSTTNAMPMKDVIATTTAGAGSSTTDVESSLLNVQQHTLVVEQLKGKIALLQERNDRLVREVKALQCKVMKNNATTTDEEGATVGALSTSSRNESFTQQVLAALNSVLQKHRRWSANRVGALVAKAVWNNDTYLPHLLRHARKHLREKVFTTYNILREMDLAGGTLSYEGIEVLRRVETCGVKRFRGSMIPSKSELKRMAGVVEWFARGHCPFELQQTKKGESVQFNYAKAMVCITQAFHLDTIGKLRSLSIASSIDGASLSKNLSVIAGGIKITDRAARCPITCRPLLDNPCTMSAQSRNLCIPLKIMMGRETKETFVEFGSLFKFLDNLADEATIPPEMAGFLPFSCMTNCDLSAQWKGLCKGGAAKIHTLPCTGCATESDALATPNPEHCTRWCIEHSIDPDWLCYHKPMATPERVVAMQAEVEELVTTLERDLIEILAESKVTRHDIELDTPPESSVNDNASIHFCPNSASQRHSFSCLLTNELILRGLDINGSLEIRREGLRVALKGEATIVRLSKEIAHGEVKEGAYFLLMQTLPCVLHMENRNGIKILSMLLVEGMSNAKKRLIYNDVKAEGTRVTRFIADMEDIINRSILGTDDDPCQWMCPFDFQKKELGPITMDNVRTRRIIDALDLIVDLCVIDDARKARWMTGLNHYRIAMVLLRKKEDFTNDMIASYQSHADKFYQAWLQLWQKEGVTNYLHMMGSGHIADYLYKWKNLYRFSQQGWEAMNSLIKTFFFRRTSHGGGVRGAGNKKSRLIPIARWLQRRMIFLCRIEESVIQRYTADHPMPEGFCTQASSQDDVYD